jgi:hypothetical protein
MLLTGFYQTVSQSKSALCQYSKANLDLVDDIEGVFKASIYIEVSGGNMRQRRKVLQEKMIL